MPYIEQERRAHLDPYIEALGKVAELGGPGMYNYVITRLLSLRYGGSYTAYNEAMGILSCVTQEWYRRAVVPYEEEKRSLNGDLPW
jgi:hypothetical protein